MFLKVLLPPVPAYLVPLAAKAIRSELKGVLGGLGPIFGRDILLGFATARLGLKGPAHDSQAQGGAPRRARPESRPATPWQGPRQLPPERPAPVKRPPSDPDSDEPEASAQTRRETVTLPTFSFYGHKPVTFLRGSFMVDGKGVRTQTNLGAALTSLGERESGTARLPGPPEPQRRVAPVEHHLAPIRGAAPPIGQAHVHGLDDLVPKAVLHGHDLSSSHLLLLGGLGGVEGLF